MDLYLLSLFGLHIFRRFAMLMRCVRCACALIPLRQLQKMRNATFHFEKKNFLCCPLLSISSATLSVFELDAGWIPGNDGAVPKDTDTRKLTSLTAGSGIVLAPSPAR